MDIETRLQQLRNQWLVTKDRDKRKTIELKAKVLKLALSTNDYQTPREKQDKQLAANVAETLF